MLPPHSTSSSCDSATPAPHGSSRRVLPYVCVPASAERAVRRKLRCREASLQPVELGANAHRARPNRRLRRLLARSRSAGSCSRDCSRRHAYSRSHSCPAYPVFTNTYKITDNQKEYIFQIPVMQRHAPERISLSRENRTLSNKTYYGPAPAMIRSSSHTSRKKPSHRPVMKDRAMTLDADFYSVQKPKDLRRRRLPNVEQLLRQNSQVRSLPDIPVVDLNNERTHYYFNSSADLTQRNINNNVQYHGYETEGSDAETTIYISIEKQNSGDRDVENTNRNKESTGSRQLKVSDSALVFKNNRKKCLSLDIKADYDINSSNKTQSVDLCKYKQDDTSPNIDNVLQKPQEVQKTRNKFSAGRRYSDSLVILKSSADTVLPTPDETQDIFKMMTPSTKPKVNSSSLTNLSNKNIDSSSTRKHINIVSINEVPTFQDYRSPNSLSPQSSIDMSLKKPLPSIIKKARNRSYSLAPSYHLDREFRYVANYLSVALSPPNPGSVHRALTPVASHLPLDDPHHDIRVGDASPEPPFEDSQLARFDVRRDSFRNDKSTRSASKQSHKTTPHWESNRSNDYGGRDNGRNNNQPQPLERRESRRGQFTRSLSNADVPPDEKAGKLRLPFCFINGVLKETQKSHSMLIIKG